MAATHTTRITKVVLVLRNKSKVKHFSFLSRSKTDRADSFGKQVLLMLAAPDSESETGRRSLIIESSIDKLEIRQVVDSKQDARFLIER
jgi:hypothetical protein